MHFVHFLFACGYFVAPSLATQFLSSGKDDLGMELIPSLPGAKSYFFLQGLGILAFVPGFIYFGFRHKKGQYDDSTAGSKINKPLWLFIALFCLIMFLYKEAWTIGTMLSTFGTRSHLGLTSSRSAAMTSVFYLAHAGGRFVAIFTCRMLDARRSIAVYLTAISAASALVLLRQEVMSYAELCTYVGVLGLAVGPMDSTVMLVFERYAPVTEQIAGILYVPAAVKDLVMPAIMGQFVDDFPIVLFLFLLGTTLIWVSCRSFKRVERGSWGSD